ncbi:MAG: response regulator [Candidatus Riflebacteria bacterium]|nr:response regulator [Candidatus Riflebacteria bacterium]
MEKRLVLVGDTKSFMVSSIAKELTDSDFEVIQSECNVNQLNRIEDRPSVFLVYVDDFAEMNDLFVYLKDSTLEGDISLSVIGTQNDIDRVKTLMPNTPLAASFLRPINVKEMALQMEKVIQKEQDRLQNKKILVVDDDGTMLRTIKSWLEKHYQVFMVNSGMAAITFLAKNTVDLILLDYEMPVTTGPQVLEMLRSEPATADIPVMFLTNKSDKTSVLTAVDLKPEKYLLKTMKPMEIVKAIDDFLFAEKEKIY